MTEPQLERWRTRKLIDAAEERVSRGRAGGVMRLYAPDMVERIVAVSLMLDKHRSLEEVGIRLSTAFGYENDIVRAWLLERIQMLPFTGANLQKQGPREISEAFVEVLSRKPQARKRFNVQSTPEDLERIRAIMERLITSLLSPTFPIDDEALKTLFTAFGLSDERLQQLKDENVDIVAELERAREPLSSIEKAVESASDEAFLLARRLYRTLSDIAYVLKLLPAEQLPWWGEFLLRVNEYLDASSSYVLMLSIAAVYSMSGGGRAIGLANLNVALDAYKFPEMPPPWAR